MIGSIPSSVMHSNVYIAPLQCVYSEALWLSRNEAQKVNRHQNQRTGVLSLCEVKPPIVPASLVTSGLPHCIVVNGQELTIVQWLISYGHGRQRRGLFRN